MASAPFAMPIEAVFFLYLGNRALAHKLLKHVEIYRHTVITLGNEFREVGLESGEVVSDKVGRLCLRIVEGEFLHEHGGG